MKEEYEEVVELLREIENRDLLKYILSFIREAIKLRG